MKFSLKLLESDSEIQQKILQELKNYMTKAFNAATPKISRGLKKIVKEAIEKQPEYQALLSGDLKYQLGIDNPAKIDNIVNIWSDNLVVESSPVALTRSSLTGGISFSMIQQDYSDVLSSMDASITDKNTGSVVPWLYWLLLGGGDILVENYEIKIGPSPRSRSGNAIMVSSNKNWRMPSKYVGVADNNWVYRAISSLDSDIENMIQKQLEQSI
jgi:hypothetical protein